MISIKNFKQHDTLLFNLSLDTTNLFDFIDVSDTVFKPKGDSLITVQNGAKSLRRIIDFGCKQASAAGIARTRQE
jgi:hypothetical protein